MFNRIAVTGLLIGSVLWLGLAGSAVTQTNAVSSVTTSDTLAKATFAGGCFWCMEPPFDKLEGVISTTSGYMGGTKANPTYNDVSAGNTGHLEVMQVAYDPSQISYEELLEVYWRNIDPLDGKGQFCDKGYQYTTAIFYHDDQQQELAEQSKEDLEDSGVLEGPIQTQLLTATEFYAAEDYHQDYYQKNPVRYKFYRYACGRDQRLEELWGKADH